MSTYHDPVKQVAALSEAYAHANRSLGFFLTAGCSFSIRVGDPSKPLVPDMAGLTAEIEQALEKTQLGAAFELAKKTLIGDGEIKEPNIEHILTYVRSLREVVGKTEARGFSKDALIDLDDAICSQIVSIVDVALPSDLTAYDHLARWIGAAVRKAPVELFTTNYDLLLEQALERARIPYFDGFVGSRHPFFDHQSMEDDKLPPRWARLWKLHGSVNWELTSSGQVLRREKPDAKRLLIHPSHLKYAESRRMPYLAMIDRLLTFMKQPSAVLMIAGYSFRDIHLNEVLLQGIQSNATAVIFAVQFGELASYPAASELAKASKNFNVLAKDDAVIGSDQAPWRVKSTSGLTDTELSAFWTTQDGATGDLLPGSLRLGDFNALGVFLKRFVPEIVG